MNPSTPNQSASVPSGTVQQPAPAAVINYSPAAPAPIHITLAPAPLPTPAWYVGPTALPLITLAVAIMTIGFGFLKTRMELNAAAAEAKTERDLSVLQARLDREHAADQAHQARITTARREVYLELISEMTKAQAAISSLPMRGLNKVDPQAGLGELLIAASKIGLLGEMKTVTMSRQLVTSINQSLITAMERVLPLEEQRDLGAKYEVERLKWNAEIDRLSGLANDFFARKVWSDESARVSKELTAAHKNHVSSSEKELIARTTFNSLYQNYSLTLLKESKSIGEKVDELINSMREELNLTTSLDELRSTRIAMQNAAETSLTEFHKNLDQMLSGPDSEESQSNATG